MSLTAGNIQESVDTTETREPAVPGKSYRKRRVNCLIAVVLIAVAAIAGRRLWLMHSGLESARREIANGRWSHARELLDGYLTMHPDDGEAHLMMAEALIKDEAYSSGDRTERAIKHLQHVDDDSPSAWEARLQEARLVLLLQLKPYRAEILLRESLRLNPDSRDTHLLMWRIHDLTGRHILSRHHFWRVFELSPMEERSSHLREWFYSEFYPEIANAEFFRRMGVRQIQKFPPEVILLTKFRENEPHASFLHAALAEYFLRNGNRKSSLALLKEAPDLQQAMKDPFFASALFETLVDFGEFERAKSCFEQWPSPREGFLYWRAEGLYYQNVNKNPSKAVAAYKKAFNEWPARFDWHLMMSLAASYRAIGDTKQANQLQSRVNYLTKKVLIKERLDWIRNHIEDIHNRRVRDAVIELYREFGFTKEADAWNQLADPAAMK